MSDHDEAIHLASSASDIVDPNAVPVLPDDPPSVEEKAPPPPLCANCGKPMEQEKGPVTINGPLHTDCVLEYRFLHQPRCQYCGVRFQDAEASTFVKDADTGELFHPTCFEKRQNGVPYTKPSMEGEVKKFSIARSKFSRKNWKRRFFVLDPSFGGIRYYASNPLQQTSTEADSSSSGEEGEAQAVPPPSAPTSKGAESITKKPKGFVPLNRRSRLLTKPSLSIYKVPSSGSSDDWQIGILFYESPESNVQRRLVFQCKGKEDYTAWLAALEAHIYVVDDPSDYGKTAKKK